MVPASESESEDTGEIIPETDVQRRQTLLSTEGSQDLQGLKSGTLWDYLQQDCKSSRASNLRPDNGEKSRDLPSPGGSSGKPPKKQRDMVKDERHPSQSLH